MHISKIIIADND